MLNGVRQFYEGVRVSAEQVQQRLAVTEMAAPELRGSLEREFGLEALTDQPPRVAGDVISLETRSEQQILRERRELTAQEQELEIIRANVSREAA